MRGIKFRGKRKLNGDWVYGSLIQIGNDWCQIIPCGTEYDDLSIEIKMTRIISDTVGEYTGLKDKNGTDIYEGDILSIYGLIYEVGFWNGTFSVKEKNNGFKGGEYVWDIHMASEIIGNIYEHKHLLVV
jgi:uncharacterized phage protein (TIGR01671 family)